MREFAERFCFFLSLVFGRLLRAGRYSTVVTVGGGSAREVQKSRRWYAPILIRPGNALLEILDTGVKVLPPREWEKNERQMYQSLYGMTVRLDGQMLILPHLAGETLAALLENPQRDESTRRRAIGLAVTALAQFHRQGFTHGDAMAENVMIDLAAGVARWFDFETAHDSYCPMTWRRADDVRALLATCVLRTSPAMVDLIVATYRDDDVIRLLAAHFASSFRRPLIFHLGQAPLRFQQFRAIGGLL